MIYVAPGCINGRIQAIGSKSYAQRAILLASMVAGATKIHNVSHSADNNACIAVIKALGAQVEECGSTLHICNGNNNLATDKLYCGESGFCLRAASALVAVNGKQTTLIPHGSLTSRPMEIISDALIPLGVKCKITSNPTSVTIQGPIINNNITLDCKVSSQVLSGLLLALPKINNDSKIFVTNLYSSAYIDITLDILSSFGIEINTNNDLSVFNIRGGQKYNTSEINIEGDWSCSAFLLVAGAVAGSVTVCGLNKNSIQCDKRIIEALESAGAKIKLGEQDVQILKGDLRAFEFDATQCPDLFPPLAALACCLRGTSKIIGASRLRYKESDRQATLMSELSAIGAKISLSRDNVMEITGSQLLGGTINSHNDHRIAMACAIAGLRSDYGVNIINESCVSKSYPGFFEILQSIRDK